ncbi:MAG: hypothetical protein AABX28_00640 [Nanoarchaeota archaeon]
MRKLTSKAEDARKNRRNQIFLGMILVFIMLFSVLGYSFQGNVGENAESTDKINYNGFEFTKQGDFWLLNKNEINFIFKNNPKEVSAIYFSGKLIDYENKMLYVYSESAEAESEIRANMFQFVAGIENACPENSNCSGNLPVKKCDENFIIIKESEEERITRDMNCIFLEGSGEELIKVADEFLFNILDVRQ